VKYSKSALKIYICPEILIHCKTIKYSVFRCYKTILKKVTRVFFWGGWRVVSSVPHLPCPDLVFRTV